jgi:hypothetical protein
MRPGFVPTWLAPSSGDTPIVPEMPLVGAGSWPRRNLANAGVFLKCYVDWLVK